jgi:hypothetical protein
MTLYPQLVRNTYFDHHDYTLRLSDTMDCRLSEDQVQLLWQQIVRDQSGLTADEVASLQAEIAEIRGDH